MANVWELDDFIIEREVTEPTDAELIIQDILDAYRSRNPGDTFLALPPEVNGAAALTSNYLACLLELQKTHGLTLHAQPVNDERTHWVTFVMPYEQPQTEPEAPNSVPPANELHFVAPHAEIVASGIIVA